LAQIHPTAVIEPGAILAESVVVGPFSLIGAEVELEPGVEIGANVVVSGRTTVGAATRVFPFACIGGEPQDQAFAGEPTELRIGENNVIREHVTIHVGTLRGGGCTRVGDHNLIMNSAHIAHDCQVGSHCIIASYCGLAGHVQVSDYAVLGAYTGVHQFARVGESVMAASGAKLSQDAAPFSLVAGDRARLVGVNSVGLKRRDLSAATIRSIKHAFHVIFHSKLRFEAAVARLEKDGVDEPEVARIIDFVRKSERGYCR
jgi:UDP-N-acetylglucosamine acyltransferase